MNTSTELKSKIEALLYCVPDGLTAIKISETVKIKDLALIHAALIDLQQDYSSRPSGIKVVKENETWKFAVQDEHSEVIREAAEPELDKGTIETLAYIAWRGGSRQCDVVRVRSNKAYRHINVLLEQEFIESEKTGLTKFLTLTKKFYRYFNLKDGQKLEQLAPETKVEAPAEGQQPTPETQAPAAEQQTPEQPIAEKPSEELIENKPAEEQQQNNAGD